MALRVTLWQRRPGMPLRQGGALHVPLGPVHARSAVESGAAQDDQRGRLDVAVQAAGCVDHDLARGDDVADYGAADLDRARADRRLDGPALGDEDAAPALELAAELTLDAERLRDHQAAVHLDAALDDRDSRRGSAGLPLRLGRRRPLLGRTEHQTPPALQTLVHVKTPRCRGYFPARAAAPGACIGPPAIGLERERRPDPGSTLRIGESQVTARTLAAARRQSARAKSLARASESRLGASVPAPSGDAVSSPSGGWPTGSRCSSRGAGAVPNSHHWNQRLPTRPRPTDLYPQNPSISVREPTRTERHQRGSGRLWEQARVTSTRVDFDGRRAGARRSRCRPARRRPAPGPRRL